MHSMCVRMCPRDACIFNFFALGYWKYLTVVPYILHEESTLFLFRQYHVEVLSVPLVCALYC